MRLVAVHTESLLHPQKDTVVVWYHMSCLHTCVVSNFDIWISIKFSLIFFSLILIITVMFVYLIVNILLDKWLHFLFISRTSFNNWDIFFRNSRKWSHFYQRNIHNSNHPPYSGGSYSFLKASCLQHWFKNWQELRKNKLTASTFSSAIGFWPRRRVQLWLEKVGAIEPFSGNCATCWNNIKEEEALERYKLITGKSVLFPTFQIHDRHSLEDDWLGASPDGIIEEMVYNLPSGGVLEIKCPFFDGDINKAFPWKRIPLHYMPQAQGLMEILDRDWMDFYVWTPNGSSLFRLYRDVEYWDTIKIALDDFWWNHVQPAREVYSKFVITKPLSQLSSLKPEPRHELCSYIVYDSKRLVDNSRLLVREIHGKIQD